MTVIRLVPVNIKPAAEYRWNYFISGRLNVKTQTVYIYLHVLYTVIILYMKQSHVNSQHLYIVLVLQGLTGPIGPPGPGGPNGEKVSDHKPSFVTRLEYKQASIML